MTADGLDGSYAESILGDSGRARSADAAFRLGMARDVRRQRIRAATAGPRGGHGYGAIFLLFYFKKNLTLCIQNYYIHFMEEYMSKETMSIHDKLVISNKALALKEAGDNDGYSRLVRSIPMPPYLAKVMKEHVGTDYLISGGWNLSEAEAEFGLDWLNR
jgi:hypothetical protein